MTPLVQDIEDYVFVNVFNIKKKNISDKSRLELNNSYASNIPYYKLHTVLSYWCVTLFTCCILSCLVSMAVNCPGCICNCLVGIVAIL